MGDLIKARKIFGMTVVEDASIPTDVVLVKLGGKTVSTIRLLPAGRAALRNHEASE